MSAENFSDNSNSESVVSNSLQGLAYFQRLCFVQIVGSRWTYSPSKESHRNSNIHSAEEI